MTDKTLLPPIIIINVSLDTSATPRVLALDDGNGKNILGTNNTQQVIRWVLTDTSLTFVPMSEIKPGFEWISALSASQPIFGSVTISADGRFIEVGDMHDSIASRGVWCYLLRARHTDGTIYETRLVFNRVLALGPEITDSEGRPAAYARMTVKNNPVIINR